MMQIWILMFLIEGRPYEAFGSEEVTKEKIQSNKNFC